MKKQAEQKLIFPKQIICADEDKRILRGEAVRISGDRIISIAKIDESEIDKFDGEILRAENLTMIPGFIQTHLHLCQTLFRGLAEELELLDWLQQRIFPYENALTEESLRLSVQLGINELLRNGTTTILDMGTLRYQEIIFEELIDSGIRAFAGKCMIDENIIYPEFKSSTDDEMKTIIDLVKTYHNIAEGRIKYAFAPRFVLTCTEKLLKETKAVQNDFEGTLFHSHSSENIKELSEIRRKFKMENIEYFDSLGLLDNKSVLAHCIHLNENEISLLADKQVKVSHCPSSNLKLGSGIADIPRYIKKGIPVSLGADGAACNNNLSPFMEMKLAAIIQKPQYGAAAMNAESVFRLATIEGAKTLNIDNETGSIEVNKKADLVLIDLDNAYKSYSNDETNIYADIVYSSSRDDVVHVMIDGQWVVKDGVTLSYDEFDLFQEGKRELKNLLKNL